MTQDNLRQPREPSQPEREPGNHPDGEPGNRWVTPGQERPPPRREGTVTDPDQYVNLLDPDG
jgi:hypothetical protein